MRCGHDKWNDGEITRPHGLPTWISPIFSLTTGRNWTKSWKSTSYLARNLEADWKQKNPCPHVQPIFGGPCLRFWSGYHLVMTNSSPWYRWPIEIDGLPINSMVIFHGELLNNQMVTHVNPTKKLSPPVLVDQVTKHQPTSCAFGLASILQDLKWMRNSAFYCRIQ